MSKRRKYSPQFKREAVAMANAPDVTIRQVAANLGIGAGMVGRWCPDQGVTH